VVRLDGQLDRVVVDADELFDLLRASERARHRDQAAVRERTLERDDVAVVVRLARLDEADL
jgi:hypothetical protein